MNLLASELFARASLISKTHEAGLRAILAVGLIISLFWESAHPSSIPLNFYGLDKVEHFSAFFVLAFLLCGLLQIASVKSLGWLIAAAVAAAMLIGGAEECYQSLIPGRTCSFGDLSADICGAITAAIATTLIATQHDKVKAPC